MSSAPPAPSRIASALIVRGLGAVHVAAFVSLWVQVQGLVGSRGLLPVDRFLGGVAREWTGGGLWHELPTLLWLNRSDAMLHALCGAGVIAGVLLALGVLPAPLLLAQWLLYLSLAVACGPFLQYQWDALLLEATLLAVLVAPWGAAVRACRWPAPSRWGTWALRWLVLRLMLLSGLVKLLSGDPSWRDLSAMELHYWTQPLPNPVAWLLHGLPPVALRSQALVTFAIELILPLLALIPGRCRRAAFWGFVALQAGIAASGNYGFFNLLTALLCVSLLDDRDFPERVRRLFEPQPGEVVARRLPWPAVAAGAMLSFALTLQASWQRLGLDVKLAALPAPLGRLADAVAPFRSFNSYGLFAVMTKERREIVVEGTEDGVTWKEYRLRWQPGDVRRAPPVAGLHLPRVDWQMWFAALGTWDGGRQAWLRAFCARLLEGPPVARRFLSEDPFEGRAPRAVRTVTWDYRFATMAEKRETGDWWVRENRRPYGPTLSRRRGAE